MSRVVTYLCIHFSTLMDWTYYVEAMRQQIAAERQKSVLVPQPYIGWDEESVVLATAVYDDEGPTEVVITGGTTRKLQRGDIVAVYYPRLGRYYTGQVTRFGRASDCYFLHHTCKNRKPFADNPVRLCADDETHDATNPDRWHVVSRAKVHENEPIDLTGITGLGSVCTSLARTLEQVRKTPLPIKKRGRPRKNPLPAQAVAV